jgi:phospholipid/cholesterol/gamma-HCH transport system permease protein
MLPAEPLKQPAPARPEVQSSRDEAGRTVLSITGHLDSQTTSEVWRQAMSLAEAESGRALVVDASGLEYCDGAGIGLLIALREQQRSARGEFTLRGLREEFRQLLELVEPSEGDEAGEAPRREGFIEGLGRATLQVFSDMRQLVVFVGELTLALLYGVRNPRNVRFKDVIFIAERAGIGATPIIALVGFLLGLILAFQSAIPMRRFGAEIFVADLLGISMLRELGPLMAAILLTARSGSAFAAELGTMKVNEEIDALTTMGLAPVRFLIVPRVIAAVAVVPILTMLMNFFGLVGGALVMLSLDFPLVTYVNRVTDATGLTDFFGGLFKAFVFGIIVAGVGCLRGLQTKTGAGAVGESTTSAVVSGIILIAVVDGLFAVIFYIVGI